MITERKYNCMVDSYDKLEVYFGHNDVQFYTNCTDGKGVIHLSREATQKLITDLQEGLMEQLLEGDTNE